MFKNSLKIARIFGINIEVDISWILVFLLFTYSLSVGYFPNVIPEYDESMYLIMGIIVTVFVFLSVLVHEFAHSLTAIREGISIKRITLFIFGGVAHLEEEPTTPSSELKITIMGPLSSVVLGIIFGGLYLLFESGTPIGEGLFFLARINFVVGIINLVPAFPLDGGRILRSLIWKFKNDLVTATKISVYAGSVFAFLLISFGFIVIFTTSLFGLWYVFMGWLLYQAGHSSYTQVVLKNSLSGITVSDVMTDRVIIVPPYITIEKLIDQFYKYKVGAFPVVEDDGRVSGIVTLNDVKGITKNKWYFTRVDDIMTPIEECYVLAPDEEAVEAMMKMANNNASRILVMENGELKGILSNTDMMRLIKMKSMFDGIAEQ